MIAFEEYIEPSEVDKIRNEYVKRVKKYICECGDEFCKYLKANVFLLDGQLRDIKEKAISLLNKDGIVCERPDSKRCCNKHNSGSCNFYDIIMQGDKHYKDFISINKNGYWLADKLGIKVCPYCNRQYVFTVNNAGTRPEFDHFLPKSKYPLLALSFYNLIPCCHICNHIKGNIRFTLEENLYPYTDSFHDKAEFVIEKYTSDIFHDRNSDFEIKLHDKSEERAKANINTFKLQEIYNEHKDYAHEIIIKAVYYNESLKKLYSDSFGSFFDPAFIAQMYYGNYLDRCGIMNRTLAKFTQDIIKQFSPDTKGIGK